MFEAAAEAGSVEAAESLALMFIKGEGRAPDPEAAFRYMRRRRGREGRRRSMPLALMYEEGRGTPPDDELATLWYGRAAENGDAAAMLTYATRLFNGIGAAADEPTAAYYLGATARRGLPVAMNRYARVLANGRGVGSGPGRGDQVAPDRARGRHLRLLPRRLSWARPTAKDVAEARRRAAAFMRR